MNTTHSIPQQPEGPQPGPETPAPQPASGKFFQWIRGLGVRRAPHRWWGGVCSGLAERWGMDPVIVRGLTVVLTLFFGVGLLAYGLAWALLPEPDGRIHAQEAGRGRWSTGMSGAAALIFVSLLGQGTDFVFGREGGWFSWPVFWIAGIAVIIYWTTVGSKPKEAGTLTNVASASTSGGDAPLTYPPVQSYAPDPQMYVKHKPRRVTPRLTAPATMMTLGLAVVVGSIILILERSNVIDLNGYEVAAAAAAAAITAGVAIVAAGAMGRAAGGVGAFAIVMLVLAGVLSIPPYNGQLTALSDSNWAPTTVSAAEAGHTTVFGDATLDLTHFGSESLTADVYVPVEVIASSVVIKVPRNIPVRLTSELAASSLTVDGQEAAGSLAAASTTDLNPQATGYRLVIKLEGAASDISIVAVGSAVRSGAILSGATP